MGNRKGCGSRLLASNRAELLMNKQEKLWNGGFGTDYHARNKFEDRTSFWMDVLGGEVLKDAWSVLEPGAGKGENLAAICKLRNEQFDIVMGEGALTGIEVNRVAYEDLKRSGFTAINSAFLDTPLDKQFPLVITRGFLMHVPKAALTATLAKIYNASSKYICLVEYYSPARREVKYHGQDSALWIDDFAGEIMAMYPDLKLVDYGFKYHKDEQGYDLTYFLLEK